MKKRSIQYDDNDSNEDEQTENTPLAKRQCPVNNVENDDQSEIRRPSVIDDEELEFL